MDDIYYDDTRLRRMIEELSPAHRRKALKGAFSSIGTKIRREAVLNMRRATAAKKTGPGTFASNKYVERGIRKVNYRRVLGFRLTVGTKKQKVSYAGMDDKTRSVAAKRNRESAVVALWAEGGTVGRKTRSTRTKRGRVGRGRPTGAMPAFRFMEKTKETGFEQATELVGAEVIKSIEKTALKYGASFR